jgi:hypothetical protein
VHPLELRRPEKSFSIYWSGPDYYQICNHGLCWPINDNEFWTGEKASGRINGRGSGPATWAMKLYHFTSERHLRGIALHGLTVGDVPTDLAAFKGRCGVWLTSDMTAGGHGLEGSAVDKSRFRLTVEVPDNALLVKWTDWASKNVTAKTVKALHARGVSFDSWYVYFGIIKPSTIIECTDMETGKTVKSWTEREPSPSDLPPVPPWRRDAWHRKLLRNVRNVLNK